MMPCRVRRGPDHGPRQLRRAVFRFIAFAKLGFSFFETFAVFAKLRITFISRAVGGLKFLVWPALGKLLLGVMFPPMGLMVGKFFSRSRLS